MPNEQTATLTAALAHASAIRFQNVPDANGSKLKDRAHDAVERAIALRRMQQEYKNTGFHAVPLDEYLTRLAIRANVPLPISKPASAARTSLAALKPWLSLASTLELTTSHVRLWVRSLFALEAASSLRPAVSFRRTGPVATVAALHPRLKPDEADAALRDLENHYPPDMQSSLQEALRLVP